MAQTGIVPKEIFKGILVTLPKPSKKSLHLPTGDIILLNTVWELLVVCMLERTCSKLNTIIPNSQAAYRSSRNTTENIFVCKVLAEKAITYKNYYVIILLLFIGKTFVAVKRKELTPDELHIIKILIKDVRFYVKVGKWVLLVQTLKYFKMTVYAMFSSHYIYLKLSKILK